MEKYIRHVESEFGTYIELSLKKLDNTAALNSQQEEEFSFGPDKKKIIKEENNYLSLEIGDLEQRCEDQEQYYLCNTVEILGVPT